MSCHRSVGGAGAPPRRLQVCRSRFRRCRAGGPCPARRARIPLPSAPPTESPLYRLADACYDEVKGRWEEGAGWEVVRELMAAAGDPALLPGTIGVVQTYGHMLDWHPHVHAIATRGGWDGEGRFVPMPFVSTAAAEQSDATR